MFKTYKENIYGHKSYSIVIFKVLIQMFKAISMLIYFLIFSTPLYCMKSFLEREISIFLFQPKNQLLVLYCGLQNIYYYYPREFQFS